MEHGKSDPQQAHHRTVLQKSGQDGQAHGAQVQDHVRQEGGHVHEVVHATAARRVAAARDKEKGTRGEEVSQPDIFPYLAQTKQKE